MIKSLAVSQSEVVSRLIAMPVPRIDNACDNA